MGAIKKHFTQSWLAAGGGEQPCTDSRRRYRRRGIWQRRFWEHTLREKGVRLDLFRESVSKNVVLSTARIGSFGGKPLAVQ
jgi:hypothetical protein